MKKPIIAVDMDDTICHLVKRAIYHNNLNFPTHPLRYEDMIHWDTSHLRHPESTHDVFYGRPGLFEELELYDEYVVDEMRKLNDAYDVIVVTAAEPKTVVEKWNWLQQHMPFITAEQFITCKRKTCSDSICSLMMEHIICFPRMRMAKRLSVSRIRGIYRSVSDTTFR